MKTALAVRTRILIVESSSLLRSHLGRFLSEDGGIEVVGIAPDAYVAREKLIALKPDVMVLDLDIAGLDGLTFLEKVSRHFPTPTVVLIDAERMTPELQRRALHAGASQVLLKPTVQGDTRYETNLRVSVKSISHAFQKAKAQDELAQKKVKRATPKTLFSPSSVNQLVLAIASSTGGTEALKQLFEAMPDSIPATVVVQHMPPELTASFAEHLAQLSGFEVREAKDGDRLCANRILLAPGDFHMEVIKRGAGLFIRLHQSPPMHGVRPAADYLLKSVARYSGSNAIGAVLTGMGRDGAEGLLLMRQAGAYTVAQDEASCVVYGMPKAAVDLGAVQQVVSLSRMATTISRRFKS